jgi:hypothetical protein
VVVLLTALLATWLLLARTIGWLFFRPDLPTNEMDVWISFGSLVLVFSVVLWQGIWRNEFQSKIDRLLVIGIVISFICAITTTYALVYRHLGLKDGEDLVHDPITCLYFSIVTWTTLGYGDVTPSLDARLIAASEAVVGYIFMGGYIWMLSMSFRRIWGRQKGTH